MAVHFWAAFLHGVLDIFLAFVCGMKGDSHQSAPVRNQYYFTLRISANFDIDSTCHSQYKD